MNQITIRRVQETRHGVLVLTNNNRYAFPFIFADIVEGGSKADIEGCVVYGGDSVAKHFIRSHDHDEVPEAVLDAVRERGLTILTGVSGGWATWEGHPEWSETRVDLSDATRLADGGTPGDQPTVTINPGDVIAALRYNEEDAAHGRSRTARFEVRGEDAQLHYHEQGNYYPAGQGPDYIIRPKAFVAADGDPEAAARTEGSMYPTYSEIRALVKDEQGVKEWDDIDEDMVDEWHADAVEIWEGEVRHALQDEIVVRECDEEGHRVAKTLTVKYDLPARSTATSS